MKTLYLIMDWLNNDHHPSGPRMQRDGSFGLLSWRDIQLNREAARLSPTTVAVVGLLGLTLPLILVLG